MLLHFFFDLKRWKGALGDKDDGFEFELTLDREVLDCKAILPVVCKALVESAILLSRDIGGITCPEQLRLVELLVQNLLLLSTAPVQSLNAGRVNSPIANCM